MATDYDTPRKTDDDVDSDSLEELKARRGRAVIPGWSEGPDPESRCDQALAKQSRDSGFALTRAPE